MARKKPDANEGDDLAYRLGRMEEWVSRYDTKASFLLGVDVAMLGFLATSAPPRAAWSLPITIFGGFALIALAAAVLGLLWSNLPRTRPPRPSLHFFGTIAKMAEDEFVRTAAAQTPADRADDLARQIHRIAVILRTKFRALTFSYWATFGALLPWATALLLFRLRGTG